ncbi:MAG: Bug family tripartite tricarboxylate transporter substrate binding protein [Ottowia sp.]|uniref:Bug family tripartite tricarboxylate transporter substrate binding protein n=1 Tax=Ottowia sp. TaxID=1898956 RepID=UPI0039E4C36E
MFTRRHFVSVGAATAAASSLAPLHAWAQKLRSTKIIVGFAPGGTTDMVARRVAEKFSGNFAENAIVDNRSGAGGQIACAAVKGAPPDGQTLLCTPYSCMVIFPYVYKKLPYDPVADFAPVGIAATTTQAMAVGPMVPASVKSLPDYVAWVKANPQHTGYGSPAAGSTSHFLGALLGLETQLPLVQVPYRGAVPGIADVVAGQIPVMFTTTGDLLPHYKAGKLRLLGTSGAQRTVFTPEVPTFGEQGFPMLTSEEWFGFYAPARTPPQVVDAANQALRTALQDKSVIDSLAMLGLVATPSSPQEMAESQRAQSKRWGPLVKRIGFTAES